MGCWCCDRQFFSRSVQRLLCLSAPRPQQEWHLGMYYTQNAFPSQNDGILGELNWLLTRVPDWVSEALEFLLPLWSKYWWIVFLYPVWLLLRAFWMAWRLETIDEKRGVYKHSFGSPGPTSAPVVKIFYRFVKWWRWWL